MSFTIDSQLVGAIFVVEQTLINWDPVTGFAPCFPDMSRHVAQADLNETVLRAPGRAGPTRARIRVMVDFNFFSDFDNGAGWGK